MGWRGRPLVEVVCRGEGEGAAKGLLHLVYKYNDHSVVAYEKVIIEIYSPQKVKDHT